MGQGLGKRAVWLNESQPLLFHSIWWDLGLLAVTLYPVLGVPPGQSLQAYPVRCLREKATVLEKEV